MPDSPTISPPASQGGQRVFDQANPAEQPRVRANPSERRSSAIANKYTQKTSEFSSEKTSGSYNGTTSSFKKRKESPAEAALKKAADRARSEILDGLGTENFRKVYQGLKRLHNADNSNSKYVTATLKGIAKELSSNDAAVKNLRTFAKIDNGKNPLVVQYSDLNTAFHRVIKGSENIGLERESYVNPRKDRIVALDTKIETSLLEMRVGLPNNDADAGLPSAMYHLGIRYRDGVKVGGVDVGKDPVKAALLFYTALDRRHYEAGTALKKLISEATPETLYELAERYRDGVNMGGVKVDKKPGTAVITFQKAADGGHTEAKDALLKLIGEIPARTVYDIAMRYQYGRRPVDKSPKWAAILFDQLVKSEEGVWPEKIDKTHKSRAMDELGYYYYYKKENYAKAEAMWRGAADLDNPDAMIRLGLFYLKIQNPYEAVETMFKATQMRNSYDRYYNFGSQHKANNKLESLLQSSFASFREKATPEKVKAAKEKWVSTEDKIFRLGICYLFGMIETENNRVRAADKFLLAAEKYNDADAYLELHALLEPPLYYKADPLEAGKVLVKCVDNGLGSEDHQNLARDKAREQMYNCFEQLEEAGRRDDYNKLLDDCVERRLVEPRVRVDSAPDAPMW